ncbi:MAG TPA: hypothetical protein VGD67_06185, partial [Pseudonocardiaceae bacterium]
SPASRQQPGPPQPCPDSVVTVAAIPSAPQFTVGSKPLLRLGVGNAGPVPCTRDLDAALQELVVLAGDGVTRLWSSNDCYPGDTDDVRTLAAGETVLFELTWAGRTSQPGCSAERTVVPAGDYHLVARLGTLTGPAAGFRMVP